VGVRHLPLSTVGLLQYLTPSLQLLLAVAIYREPFGSAHVAAFACIWSALALYSFDLVRQARLLDSPAQGEAKVPPRRPAR
jgi:chloramphenicol-sensitive protein RarD